VQPDDLHEKQTRALTSRPDIPYFKEVVIMATTCDACGHRDNEVKGGGGIEDKGRKITLRIDGRDDMSRDVLKVTSFSFMN
jgi:zinc finger protein